jgi:hypothetical protein
MGIQLQSSNPLGSSIQAGELDDDSVTAAKIHDDVPFASSQQLLAPAIFDTVVQGTWAGQVVTDHYGCGYIHNGGSSTDGDEITAKILLMKGTYRLKCFCRTVATAGILDVEIDGSQIAQFDLYSAVDTQNVEMEQTGITVASSGIKTLGLKINGKNGSSSNYRAWVAIMSFERTGA